VSCFESENVVCKHAAASVSFYLDLDHRLQSGVTVTSASASTEDASLTVDLVQVLDEDLSIPGGNSCSPTVLPAGRAILIRLSGGQESNDEVIVTAVWNQSDGDSDAIDCRVIIGGA